MPVVPTTWSQLAPKLELLARLKLSENGADTTIARLKLSQVEFTVPRIPASPGPEICESIAVATRLVLKKSLRIGPKTWKSSRPLLEPTDAEASSVAVPPTSL